MPGLPGLCPPASTDGWEQASIWGRFKSSSRLVRPCCNPMKFHHNLRTYAEWCAKSIHTVASMWMLFGNDDVSVAGLTGWMKLWMTLEWTRPCCWNSLISEWRPFEFVHLGEPIRAYVTFKVKEVQFVAGLLETFPLANHNRCWLLTSILWNSV